MSHPNKPEDCKRSLLNASYDYDGEVFSWMVGDVKHRAWLVNRLDSPTSGVVLLALNEDINVTVKQVFSTHKVNKVYYALVKRTPSVPAGEWKDTLKKDVYRGKRFFKGGQMVPAKTRYQVVKAPTGGFPLVLLKLMPLTGRTHQLRVQCQNHKHPIVGDRTYGSFSFNREVRAETGEKRMMLHAGETTVHYAFHGKVREFHAESELPEAFSAVLRFRPGLNSGRASALKPSATNYRKQLLAGRRFKR